MGTTYSNGNTAQPHQEVGTVKENEKEGETVYGTEIIQKFYAYLNPVISNLLRQHSYIKSGNITFLVFFYLN